MLGSSEESVVQAKMVKESFKKKDGDDQEKETTGKAFQLIKTAYINDPQTSDTTEATQQQQQQHIKLVLICQKDPPNTWLI